MISSADLVLQLPVNVRSYRGDCWNSRADQSRNMTSRYGNFDSAYSEIVDLIVALTLVHSGHWLKSTVSVGISLVVKSLSAQLHSRMQHSMASVPGNQSWQKK